ncbi:hypothetical protein ACIQPR_09910 [Streptomyces sp. NPDC091280]|uniref:hypothetical protein n=1 Tax=Streptomyces sp. NPDC091280 TaxID=3365984 RepID=UPI003816AC48
MTNTSLDYRIRPSVWARREAARRPQEHAFALSATTLGDERQADQFLGTSDELLTDGLGVAFRAGR